MKFLGFVIALTSLLTSSILSADISKFGDTRVGGQEYRIDLERVDLGILKVYNLLVAPSGSEDYLGFYRVMDKPIEIQGNRVLFDYPAVDGNVIEVTAKGWPDEIELNTAQVPFQTDLEKRTTTATVFREAKEVVIDPALLTSTAKRLNSRPWERIEESFNYGWAFALADHTKNETAQEIEDFRWRQVDLPHDWSIEHPVNENYPTQNSGGWVKTGVGYYKKQFTLPTDWDDRQLTLYFGGIYMNGEITVNGHYLGIRPYGFTSYPVNITPFLNQGGDKNEIIVRVDHSQQRSSRWYTGSGIYRDVELIVSDPVHVDTWGVHVKTHSISGGSAEISAETTLRNESAQNASILVQQRVLSQEGTIVSQSESPSQIAARNSKANTQTIAISNPRLWSPDSPHLYTLETVLFKDGKEIDKTSTTFGLRTLRFDPDNGFFINGKNLKLKGVCLHEDGGLATGTAVPIDVWERRFKVLQSMGCNAVRNSHNPFPDAFYELANRMGMLVIDEAFDEWRYPKREHTYFQYFDEWAERDLRDMVKRNRNHPSIIMWSIGNEIRDLQKAEDHGGGTAAFLSGIIKTLDTSRPTTIGLNHYPKSDSTLFDAVDVIGLNFAHRTDKKTGESRYEQARREHSDSFIYGSETTHSFQTRGVYRTRTFRKNTKLQPNLRDKDPFQQFFPNMNYQSSYDNAFIEHHNRYTLAFMRDTPWMAGEFRWTGIDYIGETYRFPTRYKDFGIIDMMGYPKDTYYLYQSVWTDDIVLHILPHWTWNGIEGTNIPVWVYANNCDSVELFLNGDSLGRKDFDYSELYASWDVDYAPGELKAISYKDGVKVAERIIATAGEPATIQLAVDKTTLRPNHKDIAHLQVRLVDSRGNEAPFANNELTFKIDGPAHLLGLDNGDLADLSPSKMTNRRNAFNGRALGMLQSEFETGDVTITVSAEGLRDAQATIKIEGTPNSTLHTAHIDSAMPTQISDFEMNLLIPESSEKK